jgi:PsbP-like protein
VINKQTDNFIVCVLPEYNFRINHPAAWQIVGNKAILYNNMVVGFGIPKENSTDLSFDSLCIYVLDMPANYNISLNEFIDLNIRDLKDTRPGFNLIESTPTTLGGVPAYQIVFTEIGQKKLGISAIKGNKVYMVSYGTRPERYLKYISTVEQMIASFEFLS